VTDEELDRLARDRGYTLSMELRDGRYLWFWSHAVEVAPRFLSERAARVYLEDRLRRGAI
jgi:hypothetical protein